MHDKRAAAARQDMRTHLYELAFAFAYCVQAPAAHNTHKPPMSPATDAAAAAAAAIAAARCQATRLGTLELF